MAMAVEPVDPINSKNWAHLRDTYLGNDTVVFDHSVALLLPDEIENNHDVPELRQNIRVTSHDSKGRKFEAEEPLVTK